MLSIGGAGGTYIEGLATQRLSSHKIYIPIPCFGGSSEKLAISLVENGRTDLEPLFTPWSEHTLSMVLQIAGLSDIPRILLIHGRSPDVTVLKEWMQRQLDVKNIVQMAHREYDGRTLAEKFEQVAAKVDAAIAVVTPDDRGGLVDSPPETYQARARQNVWLEVGWFWGRLGRGKILVLHRGGIEWPSDLLGLEAFDYTKEPQERGDQLREFVKRIC